LKAQSRQPVLLYSYGINAFFCHFAKGPSINDVSSEGEGEETPQKPMKGDENRYLVLGKADIVYDLPKNLQKPMEICNLFEAKTTKFLIAPQYL
jgi:hypothetical protein